MFQIRTLYFKQIYILNLNFNFIYLILILCFLDKITNKYFLFIFVQMIDKTENLYNEIFNFIFKYLTDNFYNTELELKTYCSDFEDSLIILSKMHSKKITIL